MSNKPFKSSAHTSPRVWKSKKKKINNKDVLVYEPIDSSTPVVVAASSLSIGDDKINEKITEFSFAQTISWMPSNISTNNLSSPEGMNVNVRGLNYSVTPKLYGIAHGDTNAYGYRAEHEWIRLDLWSTATDGNLYTNSDNTVYEVLRHGFRVNKAGYYKLNCTLHLKPYVTNRYNIGMRFGKKLAADAHVDSTISSTTGGIIRPSASEANFTLIGVPVASGYVNLHSSGARPNDSKHIDCIVHLDVGDEVALFTYGFGVYGSGTELFAVTEFCSFQIHSM